MTQDEIKQYIAENEPTDTKRDKIGRWTKRIWQLENSTIEETYEYNCTPEQVLENPTKYKNSFAILSTDLKEVQNG